MWSTIYVMGSMAANMEGFVFLAKTCIFGSCPCWYCPLWNLKGCAIWFGAIEGFFGPKGVGKGVVIGCPIVD